MPTGLTAPVADGEIITFNEFVWRCARQFGPLTGMREAPDDAPIPTEIKHTYHAVELEKARASLIEAEVLTDEAWAQRAKQANDAAKERQQRYIDEADEKRARYETILEQARAWEPPTPAHQSLKELMISQLEQSIDHDCKPLDVDMASTVNGETLKAFTLDSLSSEIARHEREAAEDRERGEAATAWLTALRESVGEPPYSEASA